MRLGMNVPNFGPGTNPDVLRRWALTAEDLGFDLLIVLYRHPLLIARMAANLRQLRSLGAGTVVLDPFNGDHRETAHPETAWRALPSVAELWNRQESQDIDSERS